VVERKPGAAVRPGEPLVVLHYNDASRLEEAERLVASAYQIEEEPPALPPLIREVIR
jgi:pyrimidine-nucleoside phosphorylase